MSDSNTGSGSSVETVQEEEQITQLLQWIGFTQAQANAIILEGFDCFEDIMACNASDVSELALSFQKRTVAEGKINFSLKRTKRIKALSQWTRDFRRTNNKPTINKLDKDKFQEQRVVASQRHDVTEM